MKAMNLYLVSRAAGSSDFSLLVRELTGEIHYKEYSRHEAESLRALTDELTPHLMDRCRDGGSWASFLDGFYFSYTIAHISKEFDLLKISGDGDCVLNIELKSESIEEERISKQLAQNRYYLSHISKTIYSYTYVMETGTLYVLNDKGHMRVSSMAELAEVLCKPVFAEYVEKDLDLYFRAADYLISPAAEPEKFLQGGYFLTNQQEEFKRKILETLKEDTPDTPAPFIVVIGAAGTGKTLLLFDLAMALSKRKRVLLLHGGRLQSGHRIIDERLRNVDLREADCFDDTEDYTCLLADEANRIPADIMDRVVSYVRGHNVPCIMTYDPHLLAGRETTMMQAEERITDLSTQTLEFTGNIRINRPVFSFLKALFHQKNLPAAVDYSCIDVLYGRTREEVQAGLLYYMTKGYRKITLPGGGGEIGEGLGADEIVGLEFDCVLVIVDDRFYYDEDMHLRADGPASGEAFNLLYEGISRTREKLCVLVYHNEKLFSDILRLRER